MPNMYYNPEEFGLTTVGELEYSDRDYCFNTTVVWWESSKSRFLVDHDSGCSCPCPFEDSTIEKCSAFETAEGLAIYLREEWEDIGNYGREYVTSEDIDRLVSAAKEFLEKST